ncbi:MAG: DUF4071 domain-containing protein [Bacteroidota bacterium]|nr:DUF4071 domain-containing protein [Bacteroidota bacterium]
MVEPAVIAAGMVPVRADHETVGGIIHKPMFERIILSDYVLADLTGANANVFYELGIRHAVKPYTTVSIYAADAELPFDVGPVRCIPYGALTLETVKKAITSQLTAAKKEKITDSPVYQLVDGIQFQNSVAHEKTDIFRDRVSYDQERKEQLATARDLPKSEKLLRIQDIEASMELDNEETGVLIDLMLSYRSAGAWTDTVGYIERLPAHVRHTVMVQEQYGFALNRAGDPQKAIRVLEDVIKAHGPSSETYGILGRVYKDLFDKERKAGNMVKAMSQLKKAMETYRAGFEADWRDAYPGINLVTMLELLDKPGEIVTVLPVVRYAVLRRLASRTPDYWDYATLLEIAVIQQDAQQAEQYFADALACPIEGDWMFDTTINNLQLINDFRQMRGQPAGLAAEMIRQLKEQKDLLTGSQ